MRTMLIIGLPLLLLTESVTAQPSMAVGTRVRILARDTAEARRQTGITWYAGTVVAGPPGAMTVQLAPGQPTLVMALADVTQIDVSRGKGNRRWRGMIVGGLLSGAAFTGSVCAFSNGSCSVGSNVGGFSAYFVVGSLPGVLVGGSIGARMVGHERWETVWRR